MTAPAFAHQDYRGRTCDSYATIKAIADTKVARWGRRWIGKCDLYLQTSWKPKFSDEPPPNVHGYGIVIHRDKEAVKAALRGYDFERACGRRGNNSLRLSIAAIQEALIEQGFVD